MIGLGSHGSDERDSRLGGLAESANSDAALGQNGLSWPLEAAIGRSGQTGMDSRDDMSGRKAGIPGNASGT